MRGRGLLCREVPSLALPPEETVGGIPGDSGGRGGFSERSSATSIGAAYGRLFRLRKTAMLSRHWRLWLSFPSPPSPFSSEERLAFEGCFSLELVPPVRGVCLQIGLVMVTAADRAAATCQRRGTNPSAHCWRAPPLSGEALQEAPSKGSLHRGSSHAQSA